MDSSNSSMRKVSLVTMLEPWIILPLIFKLETSNPVGFSTHQTKVSHVLYLSLIRLDLETVSFSLQSRKSKKYSELISSKSPQMGQSDLFTRRFDENLIANLKHYFISWFLFSRLLKPVKIIFIFSHDYISPRYDEVFRVMRLHYLPIFLLSIQCVKYQPTVRETSHG